MIEMIGALNFDLKKFQKEAGSLLDNDSFSSKIRHANYRYKKITMTSSKPSLTQLFLSFLRLGITAFGGPSMVVYIRKMAVNEKHWLDIDTFNDGVALCQTIPGATAMQTAANVGLKTRGIIGAAACFIGFGLPAFLLTMTFAAVYQIVHNLAAFTSAFSGLQAIIIAIIANATVMFGRTTLKNWTLTFMAITAAALYGLNVNPSLVILFAALGGMVFVKPKPATSRQPHSEIQPSYPLKPLLGILFVFAAGLLLLYYFHPNLFKLATLLARIDLLAFGGGFASVPLMFHEIVEVRGWLDSQTFMNGIILGQITPGPIVITAAFIGYLVGGFLGGIVATVSVFTPSFVMLIGTSPYFERLRTSPLFSKIIGGVLCSFVGLLFTVTIRFAANLHWDISHILLASLAFIALQLKVDILWIVITGTMISMVLFMPF